MEWLDHIIKDSIYNVLEIKLPTRCENLAKMNTSSWVSFIHKYNKPPSISNFIS